MKKTLEVAIVLTSKTTFDIEVYEPESGEFARICCHDAAEITADENTEIINEIRSWASMLRENEVES